MNTNVETAIKTKLVINVEKAMQEGKAIDLGIPENSSHQNLQAKCANSNATNLRAFGTLLMKAEKKTNLY